MTTSAVNTPIATASPDTIGPPPGSTPNPHDHHTAMQQRFGWQVPPRMNMARLCCVRWADSPDTAHSIAVIADGEGAEVMVHSYAELHEQACRLANVLSGQGGLGVARGDRVAIVLPQRFETAVAYMGVLMTGAVGMPLSMLFGPEALAYRLQDSAAVVAICDQSALPHLNEVRAQCPTLRAVLVVGAAKMGQPMRRRSVPKNLNKKCHMRSMVLDCLLLMKDSGRSTGNLHWPLPAPCLPVPTRWPTSLPC